MESKKGLVGAAIVAILSTASLVGTILIPARAARRDPCPEFACDTREWRECASVSCAMAICGSMEYSECDPEECEEFIDCWNNLAEFYCPAEGYEMIGASCQS
jgi:hypothetical protein